MGAARKLAATLTGLAVPLVLCATAGASITIVDSPPSLTNSPNAKFVFSGATGYKCELDDAPKPSASSPTSSGESRHGATRSPGDALSTATAGSASAASRSRATTSAASSSRHTRRATRNTSTGATNIATR